MQTDIFSVGVVLYQMLSGRFPYAVDNDLASVIASRLEKPDPLPQDVPQAIQHVVFGALEANPSRRFTSAEDMRLALKAALTHTANSLTTKAIPERALMSGRGSSFTNFFSKGLLKSLNNEWVIIIASTIVVMMALLQDWRNVSSLTIYSLLGFIVGECLFILLAYMVLRSVFKRSQKVITFHRRVAQAYLRALENSELDAHTNKGDSYV